MDEIWKPIPDTDYAVSNTGKVASMKWNRWRVLKPETTGGYSRVALCHHGKMASRLVHTLIANAFLPPRPSPLHEVNHKNGIKDDPRAENLEWVTRSENLRHRFDVLRHGNARGEKHCRAKLTEAGVDKIRARRAAGETLTAIAADYGIDPSTVGDIYRRKLWAWLE